MGHIGCGSKKGAALFVSINKLRYHDLLYSNLRNPGSGLSKYLATHSKKQKAIVEKRNMTRKWRTLIDMEVV